MIRFKAKLQRPANDEDGAKPGEKGAPARASKPAAWHFLVLPSTASARLPTRSMSTVEGTINGFAFCATLEPDGRGSHWLKVSRKLRESAGAKEGDSVSLEIAPVAKEPEPTMPADLRMALAAAPKARTVWEDIAPVARRDWIQWIVSAKRAETRTRRVASACDMLASGKRRVCCFDRSGIFSKGLGAPKAAS